MGTETGASAWLRSGGWRRNPTLRSTVSTGFPRGVYSGPVFSRTSAAGRIELMGSNTWEGVYFVFVEIQETLGTASSPAETPESTQHTPASSLFSARRLSSAFAASASSSLPSSSSVDEATQS